MVIEAQEEMELQREEMQRSKRAMERSGWGTDIPLSNSTTQTDLWVADHSPRSLTTSPMRAGFVTPPMTPASLNASATPVMRDPSMSVSPPTVQPNGDSTGGQGEVAPLEIGKNRKTADAEEHNRAREGAGWGLF